LTRDAESIDPRRRSFLGPLPPVFTASAHNLGLSARAKRALTPTRKNASAANTAPVFRRKISSSRSPRRDTELTQDTDAEGMAESGEHRRFGRADQPANGTKWNQMELLTATCAPFSVNKSIKTDTSVFAEHGSVRALCQNGLRVGRWFEDSRQTYFGTYWQEKRPAARTPCDNVRWAVDRKLIWNL